MQGQQTTAQKFSERLLSLICKTEFIEEIIGDLYEYHDELQDHPKWKRGLFYWFHVFNFIKPWALKSFLGIQKLNSLGMFKNYFKIAWRNALRYKGYTALNLMGLIVGIASSMLVLMWIDDEVHIDRFHENGENIYQVFRNMRQSNGMVSTTTSLPKPLGDLVKEQYSEVDNVIWLSWAMNLRFDLDETTTEEQGHFTNQEFLEVFSFEWLLGDKEKALQEPNALAISQTFAEKLFGQNWREESVGAILQLQENNDVIISGVFADIGDNSTIQFDWLAPAQSFFIANAWVNNWGNGSFDMFFQIKDESKVEAVADRVLMEIKNNTQGFDNAGDEEVIIYKFEDTYLNSEFDNGVVSGGRIDYVRIMTVVAIFILVVACINFMNLTTARSSRRSKEIGLRKVMGAPKKSLSTQFYFEAILFTAIAMAISLLVVALVLPYFNNLVGKRLLLDFAAPKTWYFIVSMIFGVGLLSGSYPAILLPTYSIIQSMKGGLKQPSFVAYFRKGLVVFQFAISTLLIIGIAAVYKQIDYVLNTDIGMNKDNLVAVRLEGDMGSRLETYKTELLRLPEITDVTAASGNPLDYGRSTSSADWEGKNPDEGYEVNIILSDEDFLRTTGMEILEGRDFGEQLNDSTNFIINEVAAEMMGFDDPIDKRLSFWGINGKIVGVVKNFHMRDFYEPIAPLIISCIDPSRSSVVLVRIDGSAGEVMPMIEEITKKLNPSLDFEYQFLDEAYAQSYESERTISKLTSIFALISILISSLGLFGLVSYSAEQRSREIGVRKVHGASVSQILVLLSKDYSKLIAIAFLLAIPFGYLVTENWLSNFEFRTTLDPFLFLLSGVAAFGVGLITVTAKSYQAATANPVSSLKEE